MSCRILPEPSPGRTPPSPEIQIDLFDGVGVVTVRAVDVGGTRWAAVGGVHRIPVAHMPGGLFLCGLDAVGPDPAALVEHLGASTLVCLQTDEEILRRHPDYLAWLGQPQLNEVIRLPTDDYLVASDRAVLSLVRGIGDRLEEGDNVLVHCGAGWGRAGLIAVLTMVSTGATVDDAIRGLRSARPSAGPESPEQMSQVDRLAAGVVRPDDR